MATKRKPPKPRNFPFPEAAITAYVEGLALIAAGEIGTPEYVSDGGSSTICAK
jgi:hypothetical protein